MPNFWKKQAQNLPWFKSWEKALEWNEPFAHWFVGGQINASYACLDIHIKNGLHKKAAIIWESETGEAKTISYGQLHDAVNNFAYSLQNQGVKKGDIVVIYLPMTPESIVATLAIARLGATHCIVFSGFSANALRDRIIDTQAKFLITTDTAFYRGKELDLNAAVDQATQDLSFVEKIIKIKRDSDLYITKNHVESVPVESNHPLFILYTSGTTGKPKGIVHSTGGYLTYVYSTIKWAFNLNKDSIYWCTADIGWITGHSYVIYGPLMHGATIYIREGAPDFPTPNAWWQAIERHKISIFYTSPTALRMFIKMGNEHVLKHDLNSLKILGSVGEPINPEVWHWYNKIIGNQMCPIIDTWWQTETGGFLISPTAGLNLVKLKPGSATFALPEIAADIVDQSGVPVQHGTKGYLIIKKPWPGMALGIHNNPKAFKEIYWSKFPGNYYTGDYAIKDSDGYFWLLGRADEVLNVAGHRIGTAEIESATLTHESVAETAVVGVQDEIKGEALIVFSILKTGFIPTPEIKAQIIQTIRTQIGAFATPKEIYFVSGLPKTRSGKIMRRLLKSIVQGQSIGDTSTLEDGTSLEEIQEIYSKFKQQMEIVAIP
jgi:acetyl-CoA synthetase